MSKVELVVLIGVSERACQAPTFARDLTLTVFKGPRRGKRARFHDVNPLGWAVWLVDGQSGTWKLSNFGFVLRIGLQKRRGVAKNPLKTKKRRKKRIVRAAGGVGCQSVRPARRKGSQFLGNDAAVSHPRS